MTPTIIPYYRLDFTNAVDEFNNHESRWTVEVAGTDLASLEEDMLKEMDLRCSSRERGRIKWPDGHRVYPGVSMAFLLMVGRAIVIDNERFISERACSSGEGSVLDLCQGIYESRMLQEESVERTHWEMQRGEAEWWLSRDVAKRREMYESLKEEFGDS